jgi:hypothetical protein
MAAVTVGHAWLPLRTTNGVESDVRGLVHLHKRYTAKWLDAGYNGFYKLEGVTKVNGVPSPAKLVSAYPEDNPSLLVAGGYVDANGAFAFYNLAAGRYDLTALDLTDVYDELAHARVQAVPM